MVERRRKDQPSRRDRLDAGLQGLVELGVLTSYERPSSGGEWCLGTDGRVWDDPTNHLHMSTAEAELLVQGAMAAARSLLGGKVRERYDELRRAGGASGDSPTRRLVYALEARIEALAAAEAVAHGEA